jgi:hypothetical protein
MIKKPMANPMMKMRKIAPVSMLLPPPVVPPVEEPRNEDLDENVEREHDCHHDHHVKPHSNPLNLDTRAA